MLVIKLGGRTFDTPEGRDRLLREIADVHGVEPVVVVHGGGNRISAALAETGAPAVFEHGLRVTDAATMQVVERVLTLIGKELAAGLTRLGVPAVAVAGRDARLVEAAPRPGLGLVGSVTRVTPDLVEHLAAAGYVVVVAPMAWGPDGDPLNVNADEVAGALAEALASDLVLLTDVDAVRGPDGDLARLDATAATRLVDQGHAGGGMRPKLAAAVQAAKAGGRVVIANGNRGGVVAAARCGLTGTTIDDVNERVPFQTSTARSASFSPST